LLKSQDSDDAEAQANRPIVSCNTPDRFVQHASHSQYLRVKCRAGLLGLLRGFIVPLSAGEQNAKTRRMNAF
jgi:hypothetical protein